MTTGVRLAKIDRTRASLVAPLALGPEGSFTKLPLAEQAKPQKDPAPESPPPPK